MELTQTTAVDLAADCLSMLSIAFAGRRRTGDRLPLELRLLGALLAELAGWAGDEWADWRVTRARRRLR